MLASQIREELKFIQSELKKPFPANLHEIRELPGGGKKWVFLRWQTVRERLDEVCPEWQSDYSEIQYLGNDAICRCGITILGIRKESIASVPISLVSGSGKEMTRGSAADRLAAEALKNSAETWGVGRYLDDQVFTIRYLWERMSELDDQMQGEVRRLSEQYKLQRSGTAPQSRPKKEEGGLLNALSGEPRKISKEQAARLWVIARAELKLTDSDVRSVFAGFGLESTADIPVSSYDKVIQALKDFASVSTKF